MSSGAEIKHAIKRALTSWNPAKHPRGRDGKFIEVGDKVKVFSGPNSAQMDTGTVVAGHLADDGRFFVGVRSIVDGKVHWYRPKQLEAFDPKADLTPVVPIPDVGNKTATDVPWSDEELKYYMGDAALGVKNYHNNPGMPDLAATMSKGAIADQIASEIVKEDATSQGLMADDVPTSWLEPFAAEGTPAINPVVINAAEWAAVYNGMIDEVADGASPDGFGFGFTKNGTSFVVTDLELATARLKQIQDAHQSYGSSELAAALTPLITQVENAWISTLPPGTPEPQPVVWPPGFDPKGGDKLFISQTGKMLHVPSFGNPKLEVSGEGEAPNWVDQGVLFNKQKMLNGDYPGWTPVEPFGMIVQTPSAPAAPSTPAPAQHSVAPAIKLPAGKTEADLINMIRVSAINKGLDHTTTSKVGSEIEAALSNPDISQAQKHLAVAMTLAKLGGKQRARYKALLAQHHGVAPVVPQAAPSDGPVDAKGIVAEALPGMKVANLTEGQDFITGPGMSASVAKGTIQQEIYDRMLAEYGDLADEYAKVIHGSPGMGNASTPMQDLLEARKGNKPGFVYKSGGVWQYKATSPTGMYATQSLPASPAAYNRAVAENAIYQMIQTWAATSNDTNVRSLTMQAAAMEEFNLPADWIYNWHSKVPFEDEHAAAHKDLYRKFLRQMYNNTRAGVSCESNPWP